MRKHTTLKKTSLGVALFLLGLAVSAPLMGTAQTDYPLRIRGTANLTSNYAEGTLSIEFQPAAAKADAGLRPGEGSWLDRALNPNEPHVLKQRLAQDEAEFVANYLQNPDHYATFYCTNTNHGYFQAGSSEPFVLPQSASQNSSVAANPAPASQLSQETGETGTSPTFIDPQVNAFIKTYEQFGKDYLAAIKAMNSGDDSKIQAMADRSATMLDTIPKIASLLKEGEKTKYEGYLNGWKDKLEAATKR